MYEGFATYGTWAGRLLVNLQALEAQLRNYLYLKANEPQAKLSRPLDTYALGDTLPENALTDWSSLGQLIERYNRHVTAAGHPELAVDESVVVVRDAIAHGRVYVPARSRSDPADGPPLIVKFERPSNGSVRLSFRQVASDDWLRRTVAHLSAQGAKLDKAASLP